MAWTTRGPSHHIGAGQLAHPLEHAVQALDLLLHPGQFQHDGNQVLARQVGAAQQGRQRVFHQMRLARDGRQAQGRGLPLDAVDQPGGFLHQFQVSLGPAADFAHGLVQVGQARPRADQEILQQHRLVLQHADQVFHVAARRLLGRGQLAFEPHLLRHVEHGHQQFLHRAFFAHLRHLEAEEPLFGAGAGGR